MKKCYPYAVGLLSALIQPALATAADNFDTVTVTASYIEHKDTDAPYASEVHTDEQIKKSGATSLYDYLDKQTSLVVLPNFGNPFAQKIDMRGYGTGDGYQNIVVNFDGRRLNNIDMSPQLLSSIPLESIDRIEIAKGSGSVVHGDAAMAGVINIYTKPASGAGLTVSGGNYGVKQTSAYGGFGTEKFDFSLYSDQYWQDGFSDADVTGNKDKAEKSTLLAKVNVRPIEALELNFAVDSTAIETRYPGPMTLAEFNSDPSQNSGNTYTLQEFVTDSWSFGGSLDLVEGLKLKWDHSEEDKRSTFVTTNFSSNYDYSSDRVVMEYSRGALSLIVGGSKFDGKRLGATNTTYKDNAAWFVQADYRFGDTLLAVGTRDESVEYEYVPNAGTRLKGEHKLTAWDLGFNHLLNDNWTLFANYNQAYQAPDIDRFFTFAGAFNGFIVPAESETVNAGFNYVGERDKLKVTLFYSELENEIYFNAITFINTNIDKSHKYGLELQEQHNFSDDLSGSINYAYTKAIIDEEDGVGGTYDGKNLPGVSEHTLSAALNWRVTPRSNLAMSHTYRSDAYAANDFTNSFSQKQKEYHSTDVSYSYRVRDEIELFAAVKNLFEESNGIWISDNNIYPVNFTRNWNIGIKMNLRK